MVTPKTEESTLIFETSEDVEVVSSFDELGLKEELLRGTPFPSPFIYIYIYIYIY